MLIAAQRFGASLKAFVRDACDAFSDFLDAIDQPITPEDLRRLDVAFFSLSGVFLTLNLGLIAWAVLS